MASPVNNPKVKVIPVKEVVHKSMSDLVAIRGHKNYYVNLLSGLIKYRKGKIKISTGESNIMAAKRMVELELKKLEGKSEAEAKRQIQGVRNALLRDLHKEMVAQKSPEWAHATYLSYSKNWRVALMPYWGSKTPLDCTDAEVLNYKEWYLKKFPKRCFQHTGIQFGVFCKWMKQKKLLSHIPDLSSLKDVDQVTARNNKRPWEKVSRVYSKDELSRLLKACDSLSTPRQRAVMRVALILASQCGLRKMEILSLDWANSFSEGYLNIWSPKTLTKREVPLTKEATAAIKELKTLSFDSHFLFPQARRSDVFMYGQMLDKLWKQIKREAKVEGRFHDLRHTFATKTAEDGWPMVLACEVLGHSPRVYARTYCKPTVAAKAEWFRKSFEGKDKN